MKDVHPNMVSWALCAQACETWPAQLFTFPEGVPPVLRATCRTRRGGGSGPMPRWSGEAMPLFEPLPICHVTSKDQGVSVLSSTKWAPTGAFRQNPGKQQHGAGTGWSSMMGKLHSAQRDQQVPEVSIKLHNWEIDLPSVPQTRGLHYWSQLYWAQSPLFITITKTILACPTGHPKICKDINSFILDVIKNSNS